jgi:hypothetical protein
MTPWSRRSRGERVGLTVMAAVGLFLAAYFLAPADTGRFRSSAEIARQARKVPRRPADLFPAKQLNEAERLAERHWAEMGSYLVEPFGGERRGRALPLDPGLLRRFSFLGLTVPELIAAVGEPEDLSDQPYGIVSYAMVGAHACSERQLRFELAPDDELVRRVVKETIAPGRFHCTP